MIRKPRWPVSVSCIACTNETRLRRCQNCGRCGLGWVEGRERPRLPGKSRARGAAERTAESRPSRAASARRPGKRLQPQPIPPAQRLLNELGTARQIRHFLAYRLPDVIDNIFRCGRGPSKFRPKIGSAGRLQGKTHAKIDAERASREARKGDALVPGGVLASLQSMTTNTPKSSELMAFLSDWPSLSDSPPVSTQGVCPIASGAKLYREAGLPQIGKNERRPLTHRAITQ